MQVNVKKLIQKLSMALLCAATLCLSGCGDIRDLEVTSVQIESIAPNGLRGVNVWLAVGIDNPAFQVGLSEIEGTLKLSGKVLGRMTMDPMVLQRRSAEIYHVKAFVSLGEDARLRDLLMLTDMNKLNECTIDVSATPRLKSGLGTPLTIKDISVKKLLENDDNEKN